MQPSNELLTELRALAAVKTDDPLALVEDPALRPAASAAYSLGKVDGRVELAKKILEDLARGE